MSMFPMFPKTLSVRAMPLALLVAACATSPADTLPERPAERSDCNAQAAQVHIGKRLDAAREERIRRDTGATRIRVFTPERNMGTTDHVPGRLNIHIDDADVIRSMACG
ncbi:MAG: I78 family peptidase inhibitor [Pseudoxanthomonas suwonensis]|nr:I78 family peptidase inhibitor [Pseudoxanthomonas suwonensis]